MKKCDVLVVIAHPDDELFVSGTLCLLADKGFQIALVCVTDGEGGSQELFGRVRSELPLGAIRRHELMLSAWALGVCEVEFIGLTDIPLAEWATSAGWDGPNLIAALACILRQADPSLILTHGPRGGYGHPAHCEVSRCVMGAAAGANYAGSIFSVSGNVPNAFFSWQFDDASSVIIDVRGFLRRRAASLSYHQSQIDFFLRPYFPRATRKYLSAVAGLALAWTEYGRKRVPIASAVRFFRKYPLEGLVLQKPPAPPRLHFFRENFADDDRVRFVA